MTNATPEGTLNYTFYASGNVESIASSKSNASSNPNGISVAYTYDAGVPVDRSTSTGWVDLNRPSTVVDNRLQGNQTTTYTYDPASNVATVQAPNGLTSTFTYDALNRLTELSTPPVADYKYTLGLTGNRSQATEQYLTNATQQSSRTLQWNYDGIYRLTGETINVDEAQNSGSASYGLDPVGNRTSVTSSFNGFTPIAGVYNANDEISSETYDPNGNVTQEANGNSHTYDSQNHMLSMTNGATVINMTYDAFGNRVAKTVNGVTTQYLVEDDVNPTGLPQVVEELSGPIGAGVVTRTYTYGLQRISQNLSPTVTGNSTWTPSFYVYDGAGSVRQLTDINLKVTDEYEYDAYGNSFTKSGTTPNNYLYRGEQFDSDLGLYYLRARYYNPNTGRFISVDPLNGDPTDPISFQKYLYANGDPVDFDDASGKNAMPVPLPPAPGPFLVPPPAPKPTKQPGAGALEYALVLSVISLAAEPAVAKLGCEIRMDYAVDKLRFSNDIDIVQDAKNCNARGKTQMRIQLQKGTTVTVVGTPVLQADDPPGVTKAQVWAGLAALWGLGGSGQTGFPKSLQRDLRSAIIEVSQCVGRQTGTLQGKYTVCQAYVTGDQSGWRIDLENLYGFNLSQ
ncbi:MAG: RHS repeat-associated core domain-containing protein [Terracidiphilus sp.]